MTSISDDAAGTKQNITITSAESERSEVTYLTWEMDDDAKISFILPLVPWLCDDRVVKVLSLETGRSRSMQLPCTWKFGVYAPLSMERKESKERIFGITLELIDKTLCISGKVYASFEFVVKMKTPEGESQQKCLVLPKGPRSKDFSSSMKKYEIPYDSTWTVESLQIRVEMFKDGCEGFEYTTVKVENPDEPVSKKARVLQSEPTSTTQTSENYQNGQNLFHGADFKFKMRDRKEFLVHKAILAPQSPVISEMLNSGQDASSGTVEITDLSSKAMEVILNVCYSGGYVGDDWIPFTEELIFASEKYELKILMKFLNKGLVDACNPGNAIELLKTARKLELKKAQDNIKTWISQNMTHEDVLNATVLA